MTQVKRRYTTIDGTNWIVTATYDPDRLDKAHWFETRVEAVDEQSGRKYPFPPEIRSFRYGETEHPFRYYVQRDWAGDNEAAVDHIMGTVFRRVYSYLERGH